MADLRCLMWMAGAALVMGLAAASIEGFQAHEVSAIFKGRSRVELVITYTYTASSKPYVVGDYIEGEKRLYERPRTHRFRENSGEMKFSLRSRDQLKLNITFNLNASTVTLILHRLPPPPRRGVPAVDRQERIPNVSLQPEGDLVYAENGDASVNLTVLTDATRAEISEERLEYTAYVRNESMYYVYENDYPATVVKTAALDNGAQYRLDFDVSQQPPVGVFILKALKIFSGEDHQLVRGVAVERRADFYPQGSQDPVSDNDNSSNAMTLVRDVEFWEPTDEYYIHRSFQICDVEETPECQVSCAVVSSRTPRVQIKEMHGNFKPLPDAETRTWMGFLTVTTAPIPRVHSGDMRFWCLADLDDYAVEEEQLVVLRARQRATILREFSSAVLEPNQKLYVKCRVQGLPAPEDGVTITELGTSSPLQDRFPNQSFTRTVVNGRQVEIQYWLDHPSVTANMTQVQCSVTNGYGAPDVVIMDVVRQ